MICIGRIQGIEKKHEKLFSQQIKGISPDPKKLVKFKIELGLLFMISDLVYKFQMICLRETKVNEWKSKFLIFHNKGHNFRSENIIKSAIKLGLPF